MTLAVNRAMAHQVKVVTEGTVARNAEGIGALPRIVRCRGKQAHLVESRQLRTFGPKDRSDLARRSGLPQPTRIDTSDLCKCHPIRTHREQFGAGSARSPPPWDCGAIVRGPELPDRGGS